MDDGKAVKRSRCARGDRLGFVVAAWGRWGPAPRNNAWTCERSRFFREMRPNWVS